MTTPDNLRASIRAALEIAITISDTIRDLGEVPEGELYAITMGALDLPAFERLMVMLETTGLISRANHLIRWIGPAKGAVSTACSPAEPDICIAGAPAVNGVCGDPDCVCGARCYNCGSLATIRMEHWRKGAMRFTHVCDKCSGIPIRIDEGGAR